MKFYTGWYASSMMYVRPAQYGSRSPLCYTLGLTSLVGIRKPANVAIHSRLATYHPVAMRAQLGTRLPTFTEAEFALLRETELELYGMNYYTSQFARHRASTALETDYKGNMDDLQENKAGVLIGELNDIG